MILESLDDITWPAVATAMGVAFVVGAAWFSPIAFGSGSVVARARSSSRPVRAAHG